MTQKPVRLSLKTLRTQKKSFISKYLGWTAEINRGGLIIPRFLIICPEYEICLRKNVHDCDISKDTFINAKEIIMESRMVKYYSEKLLNDKLSQFVIEQNVMIFLTIRGPAVAILKPQELIEDQKDTGFKSYSKAFHNSIDTLNIFKNGFCQRQE